MGISLSTWHEALPDPRPHALLLASEDTFDADSLLPSGDQSSSEYNRRATSEFLSLIRRSTGHINDRNRVLQMIVGVR